MRVQSRIWGVIFQDQNPADKDKPIPFKSESSLTLKAEFCPPDNLCPLRLEPSFIKITLCVCRGVKRGVVGGCWGEITFNKGRNFILKYFFRTPSLTPSLLRNRPLSDSFLLRPNSLSSWPPMGSHSTLYMADAQRDESWKKCIMLSCELPFCILLQSRELECFEISASVPQ